MLDYANSLITVAHFSNGFAFHAADRLFKQGINITAKSPEQIWGKECFICDVCDPYTKYSEINIQNHIQSPAHKKMYDERVVILERVGLENVFAEYNDTKTLDEIQNAKDKAETIQDREKTILEISVKFIHLQVQGVYQIKSN